MDAMNDTAEDTCTWTGSPKNRICLLFVAQPSIILGDMYVFCSVPLSLWATNMQGGGHGW